SALDHCNVYLRQSIMCASGVTPAMSDWVLTHYSPHSDFNTMHKCRKFNDSLE
ncbi:hypothetical protein LZ30DRAFT_607739, partial [Colletotrichum cereale]